jgi:F-type H+-transporting ATPase subunit b
MNFDWTTFVLEVINFLILVWLLKRFLYRPVLDAVARRQSAVTATLADAATMRTEAQRLQTEYEGRQSDWAPGSPAGPAPARPVRRLGARARRRRWPG